MARDPLEQFKRRSGQQNTGQPSSPPVQPPQSQPLPPASQRVPLSEHDEILEPPRQFDPRTGKEIYTPFHISSRRRERLEIRPETGPWLFPRYFDMADMIVNRREGTEIVLQFPAYAVYIEGRQLQQLVYALKEGRCNFIEAYDPQTFASVPDKDKAPFIKSIVIALKNKPSSVEPPDVSKDVKLH